MWPGVVLHVNLRAESWLPKPILTSGAQVGECVLRGLTVQNMAWWLESKVPFEMSQGLHLSAIIWCLALWFSASSPRYLGYPWTPGPEGATWWWWQLWSLFHVLPLRKAEGRGRVLLVCLFFIVFPSLSHSSFGGFHHPERWLTLLPSLPPASLRLTVQICMHCLHCSGIWMLIPRLGVQH